jgi:hypothetical protein
MTRTNHRRIENEDPRVGAADGGVVLAALRRWVTMEAEAWELSSEEGVRAYEQMGSFLLARLCDRFTEVEHVRSFARRVIAAVERDMAAGAAPAVGIAVRLFWTRVLEFLATQAGEGSS